MLKRMSRLAWTRWPLGGYYLFGGTHLFRFLLGLRHRHDEQPNAYG